MGCCSFVVLFCGDSITPTTTLPTPPEAIVEAMVLPSLILNAFSSSPSIISSPSSLSISTILISSSSSSSSS
jgi:hypothetical protein